MPKEYLYDEKELLLRITEEDESAFRQLFDQYSPKIKAYSLNLTRSDFLAEELVQEVFFNIWVNRAQLYNVNSIEAWLITIAKNIGSNMLRRMAHEKLIIRELSGDSVETNGLEDNLEWKQYHEKLYNAIALLPPQQRKVWIMSRQHGIKQDQIAQDLDISVYTVKEYLKKATILLKKNLLKIILGLIPSFFHSICLLL